MKLMTMTKILGVAEIGKKQQQKFQDMMLCAFILQARTLCLLLFL